MIEYYYFLNEKVRNVFLIFERVVEYKHDYLMLLMFEEYLHKIEIVLLVDVIN